MAVASMDGIVFKRQFKELRLAPPQRCAISTIRCRGAWRSDINHTQHWNVVAALAYEAGASGPNWARPSCSNKIKPAYFYSASTDLSTKMLRRNLGSAMACGFVVRLRRNNVPLSITIRGSATSADRCTVPHQCSWHPERGVAAASSMPIGIRSAARARQSHRCSSINRAALKQLGDDRNRTSCC